ncbi:hypothetical protein RTP6_005658 [Batrachochytrium dendrobatidis]
MSTSTEYISAFEAEQLVHDIQKLDISQFGGEVWERQHEVLERLNIQAHFNLKSNNEEYITQALIVSKKIEIVVHNLLITSLWKTNVFPYLLEHLISQDSLKTYFMIFSEASLVNLMQVVLFEKEAFNQIGDSMMPFLDYLVQKVVFLCTVTTTEEEPLKLANSLDSVSEQKWIQRNTADLNFSVAINSLASLRYITDSVDCLELSVLNRILKSQDNLVVLLERAPWMRCTTSKDTVQLFHDNKWQNIKNENIEVLGQIEAQVWLSLYNLLMDRECRRIYTYTKHNQQIILRLKDLLNELLIDQLPILVDLKRYLEELTMMNVPEATAVPAFSGIEAVPDAITSISDWKALAETQKRMIFGISTNQTRQTSLERFARMYDFDDLDMIAGQPMCGKCGNPATQRCSKCRSEWYCSRQCQVKAWGQHKSICSVLQGAEHGSTRTSGIGLADHRIQEA